MQRNRTNVLWTGTNRTFNEPVDSASYSRNNKSNLRKSRCWRNTQSLRQSLCNVSNNTIFWIYIRPHFRWYIIWASWFPGYHRHSHVDSHDLKSCFLSDKHTPYLFWENFEGEITLLWWKLNQIPATSLAIQLWLLNTRRLISIFSI